MVITKQQAKHSSVFLSPMPNMDFALEKWVIIGWLWYVGETQHFWIITLKFVNSVPIPDMEANPPSCNAFKEGRKNPSHQWVSRETTSIVKILPLLYSLIRSKFITPLFHALNRKPTQPLFLSRF